MADATNSLWELSLHDALSRTASASPTPGGGSIAPITGAFGLGLVLMALEVTQAKAKTPSEPLSASLGRGRALLAEISAHADRDVAVFRAYMQALALPKATAAEQAARSSARQNAAAEAARAPLTAAQACLSALELVESAQALVQRNIYSDLLAGADILHGALVAVLRTVTINLPGLADASLRESFAHQVEQLASAAAASYARICAAPAP